MNTVILELPAEALALPGATPDVLIQEAKFMLALKLFEVGRLSPDKAGQLCGMERVEFLFAANRAGTSAVDCNEDRLPAEFVPQHPLKPLAQEQFHAFQELELKHHQLLQTEKLASLGILASGVAHELNNPLSNISSSSQILIEELEGITALDATTRQELRSWLNQIDAETQRAKQIVRTLLDYSRKPTFTEQATPLIDILEKSVLLLQQRLPAIDTVDIEIDESMVLHTDPNRMQQVFINLIQNALDAGGETVKICIQARFANAQDWPPPTASLVIGTPQVTQQAILIQISDNGPGVPQPMIDHLFDPFFTTRAPGEGTGLGLYIVSEIIQEQQGGIAVTARPPGGLCFSLWLPG